MRRIVTGLVPFIAAIGVFGLFVLVCAGGSTPVRAAPSPSIETVPTITTTLYVPLFAGQIARTQPFTCAEIALTVAPAQAVYRAGDSVQVAVEGVRPEDGPLAVTWARSTAQIIVDGANLPSVDVRWVPEEGRFVGAWTLPATLPHGEPYDRSPGQEFLLMLTLRAPDGVTIRCSGAPEEPAAGAAKASADMTGASDCPACRRVVVTRPDPGSDVVAMEPFWNLAPGYSITYGGERLDAPEDDHGQPLGVVTFTTRMEYEAPVRLCDDTDLIPMRFSKDSAYGYWNPAAAKASERTGSIWTDGKANLRFFITGPGYAYPWQASLMGAYGHKIYEIAGDDFELGALSNTLNRTILHTSRTHENYYYPPYLLAYDAIPAQGAVSFARVDSLYHALASEESAVICAPHAPAENHDWFARGQVLTDPVLAAEFATIQGYLTTPGEIVVLTFFEGGDYSGHRPGLREDWYLLEGVGLVGIDQVAWPVDDEAAARTYLDAPFLRADLSAKPATRLRAQRAYVGGPLQITPLGPGTSWPLTVSAGGCYTVALHSQAGQPIPYDGRLEVESDPPSLWVKAMGGAAQWATAGVVTECLPTDFPPGEYKFRLRPAIATTPSAYEQPLPYAAPPWSVGEKLWVRVLPDPD